MSRIERSFVIPADDPTLPGHFPGAPVVPGALILHYVMEACSQESLPPSGFRRVKFLSPLLPDQPVTLIIESERFELIRDDITIATGAIVMQGADR